MQWINVFSNYVKVGSKRINLRHPPLANPEQQQVGLEAYPQSLQEVVPLALPLLLQLLPQARLVSDPMQFPEPQLQLLQVDLLALELELQLVVQLVLG
jgi:hypothetical protein